MSAYNFCRAVARHIDRRMGMKLASGLVEDRREALNREIEDHHLVAAGQRLMRVFAPELDVHYDDLPHAARPMARLIIYVAFEEEQPEADMFVRAPVMQRALAVAVRLFLEALIDSIEFHLPRSKPLESDLPPHLQREVTRLLSLKPQAITAKA